ncbi:hypothetical protein MKX03_032573 [Papaver bracteatum]|nr:hypothetical protein MKX03_032573 [Papaver bracteatum]
MDFVQRRKGPDVVDGSKLILKEPILPSSANLSLFRMDPVARFMLNPNIWILYLFSISSLGVYGIITAGRSSN